MLLFYRNYVALYSNAVSAGEELLHLFQGSIRRKIAGWHQNISVKGIRYACNRFGNYTADMLLLPPINRIYHVHIAVSNRNSTNAFTAEHGSSVSGALPLHTVWGLNPTFSRYLLVFISRHFF